MDKQIEYAKCFKDRTGRYFIENYLSTFDASVGKDVPFKLFPRQVEFVNTYYANNNIITRKPRQSGITTLAAAIAAYEIVFSISKQTYLIIANKHDLSKEFLGKIYNFLRQVPRWMWGNDFYDPDPKHPKNSKPFYDAKNQSYIKMFNGCEVFARSSGENAARGISAASRVFFDEAAFIQEGVAVYAHAVATTSAVENAKVLMISTPHGQDPLYYETYSQALVGQNGYTRVEFRWFQDPRYNKFLEWNKTDKETGESLNFKEEVISHRGDIRYDEKHWEEMEKDGWKPTSPWYIKMCKTMNNDRVKIAQELDVSFLGSSDNVIPIETIEYHRLKNVVEITEDWPLKDQYMKDTWIWKDPIPGHRYICGVDPSSGSAEDNTAIEIIDVDAVDENGMPYFDQVLEYYGKLMGDEIAEIVYNYSSIYNNALLIVEDIGGWGQAIILKMIEDKYPNLYYDDPTIKTPTIMNKYRDYNVAITDKLPGFHMSSVRPQMTANFVTALKVNSLRVRSLRVINEMKTWVWKNGRPDHMKGSHDDSLMCLAMIMFIAEFSMLKNGMTREKNVAMLKSWVVNSPDNTHIQEKKKQNININLNLNTLIRQANDPFYMAESQHYRSHIDGCLMLGGFGGEQWRRRI